MCRRLAEGEQASRMPTLSANVRKNTAGEKNLTRES